MYFYPSLLKQLNILCNCFYLLTELIPTVQCVFFFFFRIILQLFVVIIFMSLLPHNVENQHLKVFTWVQTLTPIVNRTISSTEQTWVIRSFTSATDFRIIVQKYQLSSVTPCKPFISFLTRNSNKIAWNVKWSPVGWHLEEKLISCWFTVNLRY